MKILARRTVALLAVLVVHVALAEGSAIAPKCLYSVTEANEETKVKPEKVVTVSAGGAVSVAGSNAEYPCVDFVPANGVWDLSPWGHIETQVKNTSDMPISVNMRVDQTDPFQSNTEIAYLKPGESRMLKVIFGYQYGFKPGPKLDPAKIKLNTALTVPEASPLTRDTALPTMVEILVSNASITVSTRVFHSMPR